MKPNQRLPLWIMLNLWLNSLAQRGKAGRKWHDRSKHGKEAVLSQRMSVTLWREGPAHVLSWTVSVQAQGSDRDVLGEHTVGQSPAMTNTMDFGLWTDSSGSVECKQVDVTEVEALRKVMEVGNDSFYSGSFVIARDGTYHFTGYWAADKEYWIERLQKQHNCMDAQCICTLIVSRLLMSI